MSGAIIPETGLKEKIPLIYIGGLQKGAHFFRPIHIHTSSRWNYDGRGWQPMIRGHKHGTIKIKQLSTVKVVVYLQRTQFKKTEILCLWTLVFVQELGYF